MPEYLSTFHQSLVDPDTFSITWELVPGRGAFESAQKTLLRSAEEAAKALLAGLERRKYEIIFPTGFVLAMKMLRLVPNTVYFWVVRTFIWNRTP